MTALIVPIEGPVVRTDMFIKEEVFGFTPTAPVTMTLSHDGEAAGTVDFIPELGLGTNQRSQTMVAHLTEMHVQMYGTVVISGLPVETIDELIVRFA